MKFKIERASFRSISKRPCIEAHEGKITDMRGLYDGHHLNKYRCWYIDIDSIEDLEKLKDKYGELILTTAGYDNKIPKIIIYDDYIE